MNLAELQKTWKSPLNRLPSLQQEKLVEDFARQMIRRRRTQSIWLATTFLWLAVGTGVAVRAIALGKTDISREWGLLPLLLVPWGFALHFLRQHVRPPVTSSRGAKPLVDSLRAEWQANLAGRSQMKRVGALYLVMIPLLALAMQHLYEAGKISPRELASMAGFFGVVLSVSAAGMAWCYFARLSPRLHRLEELLRECDPD